VVGVDPAPGAADQHRGVPGLTVGDRLDAVAWPECERVLVVVRTGAQAFGVLDDLGQRLRARAEPLPVMVVTTLSVEEAKALAPYSTERIRAVEAPAGGGAVHVLAGEIQMSVAGPVQPSDVTFLRETFAGAVTQLPELGQPALAKLLSNAVMASHVRVLCSAVAVAKAAGLDERAFYDVLVSSSGTSRAAERIGTVNPDLLVKDVKLLVSSVAESEDLLKIVRLTDPDQAFGAAVRQIRGTLAL
jgi:3-hydroxyisobutyrate dehydrogenase-like beta-hydroxyacid dehydrogenase